MLAGHKCSKESHIEQFRVGKTAEDSDLHYLSARLILETYKEATAFEQVLHTSPRDMDEPSRQRALFHYSRFIVLYDRCGGGLTPKFHLLVHQVQEYEYFGNCRFYHTYADESFNSLIAKIARACHRRSWAENVFKKLSVARHLGRGQGFV